MLLRISTTRWHYETAIWKVLHWRVGGGVVGGKVAAHTPHSDRAIIY